MLVGVASGTPAKTNSAWLSQVNGKWVYHCPTCTDDQAYQCFSVLALQSLRRWPYANREDWAAAAKEWLTLHGVALPERPVQPVEAGQRISALLPKNESD